MVKGEIMVDISKAWSVQGWMIESELKWLAEQASKCEIICEVGAWLGRTTRALADNTAGIVYSVDTWEGSAEHQEMLKDKPKDWLFSQFVHNTADLTNLYAVRKTSVEAAKELHDLRFHLIFLDANHEYESVRDDILAWRPLLAKGGILCGHDYGPSWPGVMKAVDELIPDHYIATNEIWVAR